MRLPTAVKFIAHLRLSITLDFLSNFPSEDNAMNTDIYRFNIHFGHKMDVVAFSNFVKDCKTFIDKSLITASRAAGKTENLNQWDGRACAGSEYYIALLAFMSWLGTHWIRPESPHVCTAVSRADVPDMKHLGTKRKRIRKNRDRRSGAAL